MRYYLSVILILLFCHQSGFTQTHTYIKVNLLKGNEKIDELLRLTLDSIPTPKNCYCDEKYPLIDYALLYIINFPGIDSLGHRNLFFYLRTLNVIDLNYTINAQANSKFRIGYFKYKAFKIFVIDFDSHLNFFSLTKSICTFDYLQRVKTPDPPHSLSEKEWRFMYDNGRFTPFYMIEY